MRLLPYTAHIYAFRKIFLNERINNQDGDNRTNYHRINYAVTGNNLIVEYLIRVGVVGSNKAGIFINEISYIYLYGP